MQKQKGWQGVFNQETTSKTATEVSKSSQKMTGNGASKTRVVSTPSLRPYPPPRCANSFDQQLTQFDFDSNRLSR